MLTRAAGVARIALVAAAAAPPAFAQTAAQPPADIVVTGRGLADVDPRSDAIALLDRERSTHTASNRLEDALGDIAGLQSFRRADSRSANPTSQGITLRGIGGNASSRALLILDGVPQADPFAGWVAFPAYAPARLGRVRVQRGGGSALWGSGALSGVIEMTSATPDQLAPLTADIFHGERDAIDAQASASVVREGGFSTFGAGYARGDGFVPIVAEDRGAVDRPAPYEQANLSARTVLAIAAATELQATVQAFSDRRERGQAFTAIASEGADASVRLVGRGRWGWSVLGYVQTRNFASSFASVAADRATVTRTLDQYDTPATGLGARVEIAPPPGERVALRAGGDVRETSGETRERFSYVAALPTRRRVAGGTTRTLGGFVDLKVTLGDLRVDANARLDRWWIADGRLFEATLVEETLATGAALTDLRFADRSGTEPTGRFGLAYAAAPPLTLRAAAYRGWRLPTPNELYRPFRAGADATAANAMLAPETLEGVEAGFDLALEDRFTLAATLFANRLNGAIANVTVAAGPGMFPGVGFVAAGGFVRRRDNLDAIESRGVEIDARARLGDWRLGLSYAHANATVDAGTFAPALDGLRPAQVPRHQAAGTIGWGRRGVLASATLRHAGEQFEDDQNSRSLDAAWTLDAVLALPLARGLAIEGRAENLFDARVETGFSGTARERARPRQLWIGVRTALE